MKHILLFFALFIVLAPLWAQAPKKFNYQGIARNNSGTPLANQSLGIRLSIINDSASGELRYREAHTVTTNAYGLYNLPVGGGTADSNTMDSVIWAVGDKWMLLEIDPAGGTNYVSMGATQLLSVPYALYSENPGNPGPPGPPGVDGAPGAPGTPGVLMVATFGGSIGTIPGFGSGFAFVGPTTSVTLISGFTRITGSASAALSTLVIGPSGPLGVATNLCYQQGAGLVTSFTGSVFTAAQITDQMIPLAVSASVVLPPGTYTVGYCLANGNSAPINDNGSVNGWVMVTPP